MKNKELQTGLLFNHLPELLFFSTKLFASETNMLLKLAKIQKKDNSITSDHQFFRDAKKNILEIEEFESYLCLDGDKFTKLFNAENLEDISAKHSGGWFILKSIVCGFRGTLKESEEPQLFSFMNFVESHCDLEYEFIKQYHGTKDISAANDFIDKWLKCDNIDFINLTNDKKAEYIISLVMYWAALFEKFLEIEFGTGENGYNSLLMKVLPTHNQKNQSKIHLSNEAMLIAVKAKWAKERYNKNKITWDKLYSDIAKARLTDPKLTTPPLEHDSDELISPDISAIKKQFSRWRKGSTLTIDHALQYTAILRTKYKPEDIDYSLFSIVFINLFTFIQKDLLNANIATKTIVDKFKMYAEYKDLVDSRFQEFYKTGELTP